MTVISKTDLVRRMLERVARDGQITYESLMSLARTPSVVRARRRAWEILHTSGFSHTEIANLWKTDSSTVTHGIHAYEKTLG